MTERQHLQANIQVTLDFKVNISPEFVLILREHATKADATDFIKEAVELFPTDDQGFALYVVQQNVRGKLRLLLRHIINTGGVTGQVSPARTLLIEEPTLVEVNYDETGETPTEAGEVPEGAGERPDTGDGSGNGAGLGGGSDHPGDRD